MLFGTLSDDGDVWKFPTRIERVVDGDTVDLEVDLGFSIQRTTRFRLAGVDTAEIYGVSADSAEYDRGIEHAEFVAQWFDAHDDADREFPLIAWTAKKTGKYGRYITEIVHDESGDSLNRALVDAFDDISRERM